MTTPIDYRKAAENARQIVRPYWDLMNLHAALDAIASGEVSVQDHLTRIENLRAEIADLETRRDSAKLNAELAEGKALEALRQQTLDEHARLARLQETTAEHVKLRDEAKTQADEAVARLETLRASIRNAAAAVA